MMHYLHALNVSPLRMISIRHQFRGTFSNVSFWFYCILKLYSVSMCRFMFRYGAPINAAQNDVLLEAFEQKHMELELDRTFA